MHSEDMNGKKTGPTSVDEHKTISRREALKKSAVALGTCYLAPATMELLLADKATAGSVPPGPVCPSLIIINNSRQDIEITWIPCGLSVEMTSLVTARSSLTGQLNPADKDVGLRQLPASLPPYPCNGSSERAAVSSSSGWDSVSWGYAAGGGCPVGTAFRPTSTATVLTITFVDE